MQTSVSKSDVEFAIKRLQQRAVCSPQLHIHHHESFVYLQESIGALEALVMGQAEVLKAHNLFNKTVKQVDPTLTLPRPYLDPTNTLA